MIRISLLISIIFLNFNSLAQEYEPKIDSLKSVLSKMKDDSLKVNSLIDIGMLYINTDIIASIRYGAQAQALAEVRGFKKGQGNAMKLLGLAYSKQGNFPKADIYFKSALQIFENINFKVGISSMLNNLGNLSSSLGDDAKSIEYYLSSLKIAEEINNKLRIGTSLLNIGSVYATKSDSEEKAIGYFRRALPIFEEINYADGVGTSNVNIGEIYYNNKIYDSALVYLKASIKIFQGTPEASVALSYVGDIYAERNDFDSAFFFHNQAIAISEKFGAQLYLAQSLLGLAKTHKKSGALINSIETFKKALKISESIKTLLEIKKSREALADCYAELGDYEKAYAYETLLTSIKDTLYNTAEDKKIQQLQFNFNIDKKEAEIELHEATIERQKIVTYATGISGFLLLIVAVSSYQRYKYVRKTNKIIQSERDRSQELLLNILPEETARELEVNGHAKTRFYENVTVLFTDFKGFSTIAGKLTPIQLVAELNDYFMAFDEIMGRYNLEKIKTIGDAYMCAGGIPATNNTHPLDAVNAALAMQAYMEKRHREKDITGMEAWELRIGIHTGPVVAGVVGKRKYAYDIWGDTVNIASRMESNGEPGKVNISSSTYNQIKGEYQCLHRGKIYAKNIGDVDMYFVEGAI